MKKVLALTVIMLLVLSGCNDAIEPNVLNNNQPQTESTADLGNTVDYVATAIGELTSEQNILIAYFSATGNTRAVAEHITSITGANIFEIVPEIPYTADDLNWRDRTSRSITEQEDNTARPVIVEAVENMEGYDIVFVGFPIWNGLPPRIIYTFLESYDFSGMTIIPFSTSNTTGISRSMTEIRNLLPDSYVLDGVNIPNADFSRFGEVINEWVSRLNIGSVGATPNQVMQEMSGFLYLQIGDAVLTATLAENTATETLIELLAENPITIDMRDFGGFEKVGHLGTSLPRSDERISTNYGDIMLFQGNQLVIFYASHAWSYTRIGRINDTTQAELIDILGDGNVIVTLSLTP